MPSTKETKKGNSHYRKKKKAKKSQSLFSGNSQSNEGDNTDTQLVLNKTHTG